MDRRTDRRSRNQHQLPLLDAQNRKVSTTKMDNSEKKSIGMSQVNFRTSENFANIVYESELNCVFLSASPNNPARIRRIVLLAHARLWAKVEVGF